MSKLIKYEHIIIHHSGTEDSKIMNNWNAIRDWHIVKNKWQNQ